MRRLQHPPHSPHSPRLTHPTLHLSGWGKPEREWVGRQSNWLPWPLLLRGTSFYCCFRCVGVWECINERGLWCINEGGWWWVWDGECECECERERECEWLVWVLVEQCEYGEYSEWVWWVWECESEWVWVCHQSITYRLFSMHLYIISYGWMLGKMQIPSMHLAHQYSNSFICYTIISLTYNMFYIKWHTKWASRTPAHLHCHCAMLQLCLHSTR